MIKRILVVSAFLVSLIGLLVFPAGAAGVDYNDLISNIVVDGDNDLVTVSVPSEYMTITIYEPATYTYLFADVASSATVSLTAEHYYSVVVRAFEFEHLLLNNIPDNTMTAIVFSVDSTSGYETPLLTTMWDFWDSRDVYLSSDLVTHSNTPLYGVFSVDGPLSKPSGAFSGCVSLNYSNFSPLFSRDYTFKVESFDLVFSISSLYRLQQQTGKTNEILTEVEKQLADQGKTLDDVLGEQQETNDKLDEIINGTVDPSAPAGSGNVGDLDDAEAGLRDDAQSGLDQGIAMQQSALSVFLQYAAAFAVAGDIFGVFADIPFFSFLLYVSVAIGLFALLLNLGLNGISAYERKQHRSKKGG